VTKLRCLFTYVFVAIGTLAIVGAQAETKRLTQQDMSRYASLGTDFTFGASTAERKWAQIAWDNAQRRLLRLIFSFKDPLVEQGYDLAWQTRDGDAKSGNIDGFGVVTWRVSGGSSSDPNSLVAQYMGEVRDGIIEGDGRFRHISGFEYEGSWRHGQPHGRGRIRLANGDEFSGFFREGQPHGRGVYVDASGVIFDGGFAGGKREGTGTIFLPGRGPYTANWNKGQEVPGTSYDTPARTQKFPILRVTEAYDQDERIKISVISDPQWARRENFSDFEVIEYDARSRGEVLEFKLANQRLYSAWKGSGNIVVRPDDYDFNSFMEAGFLGQNKHIKPVPIVIKLENGTQRQVSISDVTIAVESSSADLDPVVHIISPASHGFEPCASGPHGALLIVQNFGWGKTPKSQLRYSIDGSSQRGEIDLGELTEVETHVDFEEILEAAGVGIEALSNSQNCETEISQCFSNLKNSGVFGDFENNVRLSAAGNFLLSVSGVIETTSLRDGDQVESQRTFQTDIDIGEFDTGAECGEGGLRDFGRNKPFDLRVDGEGYDISLGLQDTVNSYVRASWRVQLQAPRSSHHKFRFVFELSDGRKLASRPVDLEYFRPKTRTWNESTENWVVEGQ